ncbi:DUF6234 family protein [Streptomyces buecherae]|uniref:DUF6234 domain-containing protein n=1 Tax=Streptomyces buecherae TaxID=2763006 RepID=A0A7H8NAT3_9ACTN|nr:DUF6234 family protein [Streptomyces buecherae]QKW51587.1 hypothetical protein HUT08_21020 [Streptomyces buecherae]
MDILLAIVLFLVEVGRLAVDAVLGVGLDVWAAQGEETHIAAAERAYLGRLRTHLTVALCAVVLAAVFRARRTAYAHVWVALVIGVLLLNERDL